MSASLLKELLEMFRILRFRTSISVLALVVVSLTALFGAPSLKTRPDPRSNCGTDYISRLQERNVSRPTNTR